MGMIGHPTLHSRPVYRPTQAINIAAGGTGAELTPQDTALAAAQQARLRPQPPPLHELHALAAVVNAQPLPGPSDKQHGIKLPPGERRRRDGSELQPPALPGSLRTLFNSECHLHLS
jgi:hypothetical protein